MRPAWRYWKRHWTRYRVTGGNDNDNDNGPSGATHSTAPMTTTTTTQPTARAKWLEARAHLWSLMAIVWSTIRDAAVRRLETVQVPLPRWLDLAILRVVEAWEAIPAPIRTALLAAVTSIGMAVALTVREAVTFTVGMAQRQWALSLIHI